VEIRDQSVILRARGWSLEISLILRARGVELRDQSVILRARGWSLEISLYYRVLGGGV